LKAEAGSAPSLPRRGEIWAAELGENRVRHWVLVVSVDARNQSTRSDTVLIVPFGSAGSEGPTVRLYQPGQTGLPGPSYLKAHYVTTLPKRRLLACMPRSFGTLQMREVVNLINRALDPDASYDIRQ